MTDIKYSVELADISTQLEASGKGVSDFIDSVKTTYKKGCNYFMVVISHPNIRYMKTNSFMGGDDEESPYTIFWLSPWLEDPEVYDVDEFEEVDEEDHPDYFRLDLIIYHPSDYVFVKAYKRVGQTCLLFVLEEPFYFKPEDLTDVELLV